MNWSLIDKQNQIFKIPQQYKTNVFADIYHDKIQN